MLLQAHEKLATFRSESTFRTWPFSIATRRSLDHLRARKRWPASAQTHGATEHVRSPEKMAALREAASDPGFEYDYREHVAYCFSCIGRSLDPEEAAALLLRDVFELSNEEAAAAMSCRSPRSVIGSRRLGVR